MQLAKQILILAISWQQTHNVKQHPVCNQTQLTTAVSLVDNRVSTVAHMCYNVSSFLQRHLCACLAACDQSC